MIEPQGSVEFLNACFKDAVGDAVPFEGARPQRWPWALYRNPQSEVARLALNHLGGPLMWQIFFSPGDGWLGFFNHSDGNPVIELVGDTAAESRAEICAWGHDVHFILRALPDTPWHADFERQTVPETRGILSAGQTLRARYRLLNKSYDEGARLVAQASLLTLSPEMTAKLTQPAYHRGTNFFNDVVSPDQPGSDWFWTPSHQEGLTWARQARRQTGGSLYICNASPRQASWRVALGRDFFMLPFPQQPHRLSGWIRTADVQGAGVALAFRYSSYDMETGRCSPYPTFRTEPVCGTREWTYAELVIDAPPNDAARGYIQLEFDGTGEAWFDEVALEPI